MCIVSASALFSFFYIHGNYNIYFQWENRNWLTNKHDHAAYLRDLYITGSEFIPRVSNII